MTDISKFIPELSAICTIYSKVLFGKTIGCEETLSLVAFYNSFPSVQNIEAGILDLVLKAPKERMDMILKSLYSDLNRIVMLYKENNRYYEVKDLRWFWHQPLSFVEDDDIRIQQEKTQEAWEDLKEASNSYEMTPFNGMSKEEADVLERRVNKLKDEYEKEKTLLNNLYYKKKNLEDERRSIPEDIFKLIYLKCHALLPAVEKYYNKPIENEEEQSEQTDSFLSMSLSAKIYKLCNGIQFEAMSELDFFESLNLHKKSKPLKVRKNRR